MMRTPHAPFRRLGVVTAALLCVATLSACGEDEAVARAEQDAQVVGDAIQAQSEESGSDITTAIAEDPWKGDTDAFVSGTYDFLVVNVDEAGCAKLVFASDEPGADYTVEDAYEC